MFSIVCREIRRGVHRTSDEPAAEFCQQNVSPSHLVPVRGIDQSEHSILVTWLTIDQSQVWSHFLTCTDEKRWKNGKRKAEKDPLVGGSLYAAVRVPDKPLDSDFVYVDSET